MFIHTAAVPAREAWLAGISLDSAKAYLLDFARRSIGLLEARELASSIEVDLAYRLGCLYVGQRVFLGVASAEASRGVDTQGRERGCCGIRRGNDCGLGSGREGELSHGGIRIYSVCMRRGQPLFKTGA